LKSKLAGHIQKLVEIVVLQNLSGVFDFSSLQDQEIVGKKIKYITNFGFSNFHYLFQMPCFLTPCSIFDEKINQAVVKVQIPQMFF
jgi:hypothetical protein